MKLNILRYLPIALAAVAMMACDDFLDKQPESEVVPESYYQSEDQVQAAVNVFYADVLPSHSNWSYGTFGDDADTDNMADQAAADKYITGVWTVPLEDDDNWDWTDVRDINYALNTILDNYNEGAISGTDENIRHYIGELYFFRAFAYFTLLQKFGDLPIIEEALTDDEETLLAYSIREPRNEVSRFILEDLDTAIDYMMDDFDSNKNRVSPDAAKVFKSRVALYEATFLKYFKGTAFVPNGTDWPGAEKDYNSSYSFPSGSIDNEIDYFLGECMDASADVADDYIGSLVTNTGIVPQSESDSNPYFFMFGATDMSGYSDVLLWRQYSEGLSIVNCVEVAVNNGDYGVGLTRSMVESFVMSDGKPIYADHDGFEYDDTSLANVRTNADPRLYIFLKEPGQLNLFLNMSSTKDHGVEEEPVPAIFTSTAEQAYPTGYSIRKGGTFDKELTGNGTCTNGSITFRVTEAILNYIEASYELNSSLTSKALQYWEAVRTAAGFEGDAIDPYTTINATVMENETLDWGAYSAGELLDDPILYNIRRERRCELMAEALRWMDVQRWRSLDQLMDENYHIEGFHFWNTEMYDWYDESSIVADGSSSATMSSSSLSEYFRPYEKNQTSNNLYKDGYTWHMAHYLYPLPVEEFQLTATDYATPSLSTLYQNPYWPTTADSAAEY